MELMNEPYYELTLEELKDKLGITERIVLITSSMSSNSVKIWIDAKDLKTTKRPSYI